MVTKTAHKLEREADVEGLGTIYAVEAPFDEALETLRKAGIEKPITVLKLAQARMQFPKSHSLNDNGSYTVHGFSQVKGAYPLITRVSPLVTDSGLTRAAVKANRSGRYFSTDDRSLYEEHLAMAELDKDKEPIERSVLRLPSGEPFPISPKENPEVFHGLLGNLGTKYLKNVGFSKLMVYPVSPSSVNDQDGTLLTQLWLHRLGGDIRSSLVGVLRYFDNRVRGVSENTGEASARSVSEDAGKSELIYNPQELRNYRKILEGVRHGNIPASQLEEVLSFIESLPAKEE